MSKNDQEEAFEKLLSSNLSRVFDFVKFGEAKNAALLTFNSAWIIASVTLLFGTNAVSEPDWVGALTLSLPLFCCSAISCVFSFFPRIALSKFHRDPQREKSLLFFGDICSFSPESYRDRIKVRYLPQEGSSATQAYLDDLAVQINVNSKIAVWKFQVFKVAAGLTLIALIVLAMPAIRPVVAFLFPGN